MVFNSYHFLVQRTQPDTALKHSFAMYATQRAFLASPFKTLALNLRVSLLSSSFHAFDQTLVLIQNHVAEFPTIKP
jgi:hypothetical protein